MKDFLIKAAIFVVILGGLFAYWDSVGDDCKRRGMDYTVVHSRVFCVRDDGSLVLPTP